MVNSDFRSSKITCTIQGILNCQNGTITQIFARVFVGNVGVVVPGGSLESQRNRAVEVEHEAIDVGHIFVHNIDIVEPTVSQLALADKRILSGAERRGDEGKEDGEGSEEEHLREPHKNNGKRESDPLFGLNRPYYPSLPYF